jgi:hypothetical protein
MCNRRKVHFEVPAYIRSFTIDKFVLYLHRWHWEVDTQGFRTIKQIEGAGTVNYASFFPACRLPSSPFVIAYTTVSNTATRNVPVTRSRTQYKSQSTAPLGQPQLQPAFWLLMFCDSRKCCRLYAMSITQIFIP